MEHFGVFVRRFRNNIVIYITVFTFITLVQRYNVPTSQPLNVSTSTSCISIFETYLDIYISERETGHTLDTIFLPITNAHIVQ